jgi:hypothetical protein
LATETYFTLTDSRFFVGTVGMLNSLRLMGARGELVVLDRGLAPEQRLILGKLARIEPVDPAIRPFSLKPSIRRLAQSGVVFWIDSDMILTRDLRRVSALAKDGKVCLYPDWPPTRWISEWHQAFQLRQPLRRQPYLNAGFLALSVDHWAGLLERWAELCELIPGPGASAGFDDPFLRSDQDALNALLMSEVPRDDIAELPEEEVALTKVAHQVRVASAKELVCYHRGQQIALIHYVGKLKPWMPESWARINRDAYVRLLLRLLFDEDVELRLPLRYVPQWLRPTLRGRVYLSGLRVVHGPRARLQDFVRPLVHRLPASVRDPILRYRGRIMHGHR